MCDFLAKQLWLTTPLAMKSPVPVVMSYIGTCSPSRSMPATRRPSPVSTVAASIDRRAVTAGSTVWKNRSASASPPRTRTQARPAGRSTAKPKPSDSSENTSQPLIAGSAGASRRTPSR